MVTYGLKQTRWPVTFSAADEPVFPIKIFRLAVSPGSSAAFWLAAESFTIMFEYLSTGECAVMLQFDTQVFVPSLVTTVNGMECPSGIALVARNR